MVRIDASLRRIHRSEEVESPRRLVEEPGKIFASEYRFDNLCLYARDLLEYLHSLLDRKSTRLNSSHRCISYAVFCLKKKKKHKILSVQSINLLLNNIKR